MSKKVKYIKLYLIQLPEILIQFLKILENSVHVHTTCHTKSVEIWGVIIPGDYWRIFYLRWC